MQAKHNTITIADQRVLMLEMLKYVDSICRQNSIRYSLIGGSLIGAVRHGGFIPWDDDIDIILTVNNYEKLKRILDKGTGTYQTLKRGNGGERFNFIKLVDTRTCAKEGSQSGTNNSYGVYIDLFCYYPTAQALHERVKHYKKISLITQLTARLKIDFKKKSTRKNIRQFIKNFFSIILGYNWLNKKSDSVMNMYRSSTSDFVVSNWPIYGFEKEIQLQKNTEEYIDMQFENLTVMVFKNYDEILKTTFGNYMQLPPESERIPKHCLKAWWREGFEGEAERLKKVNRGLK